MATLGDALPHCDFDDCWSRNNPDQAYGDEGIKCTANGDEDAMEPRWTAMGGDSHEFWACEVCLDNAPVRHKERCAECGTVMVAYGVRLVGREFCVNCMPMDTLVEVAKKHGLALDCEWTELAHASQGEGPENLVHLFSRIGEDLVRAHDAAAEERAEDEGARKRRRVECIVGLFPGLSAEEAADIDDGREVDESTTVYEFLKRARQ